MVRFIYFRILCLANSFSSNIGSGKTKILFFVPTMVGPARAFYQVPVFKVYFRHMLANYSDFIDFNQRNKGMSRYATGTKLALGRPNE